MKTVVQPPHQSDIGSTILTGTIAAGAFVDLPAAHGVACYPEGGVSGDRRSVYFGGTYRVVKASGDGAWLIGDVIYLDDAAQEFTDQAGAHQIAGLAMQAEAAGSNTGIVKLVPQVS